MFTITVKYDEKQSTTSQYENVCAGVLIERSHMELHSPEELLQKTTELFALAREAVQRQLAENAAPAPRSELVSRLPAPVTDTPVGGAPPQPSRGNRRFGRPENPPTEKQRILLHRISKDRHLGPESVREICERIVGQPVETLDKQGMSKLLDGLLHGERAA